MNDFKGFIREYRGAIIGALIAIIILCTRLYQLIIWVLMISAGVFVGNYVQRNKSQVKEKIKSFIDKL